MANLIIDIGNTALKAAWCQDMTIGKTFRYQGEKVRDFILSLIEKEKPEVMVVSSVYVVAKEDICLYKKECKKLIILDSNNTNLLTENNIPSYITYDRLSSILAVRYLFKGKGCTIFDFGNTLTIDIIAENGDYLGGNISLGQRTRYRALNKYSKALPLVNNTEDIDVFGNNLQSSINSGVIEGMMFEIEGYISLYPNNIIIFTGGDANYFAKRTKNSIFVVYNLVLMGLALIAKENVKEKN